MTDGTINDNADRADAGIRKPAPGVSEMPRANKASAEKPAAERVAKRLSFDVDPALLRENRVYVEATDETSKIAISAYKSLRTHILRELQARNVHSLVVTGTTAGVGKSVTAANLAVNIARHKDHKVLLVDLDLRAPTVAQLFGFKPTLGIDHIETASPIFPAAVVHPNIQNLALLPCTRGQQDSTEMLLAPKMRALLNYLRTYRQDTIVIFDAPPVLGCDDVAAITPFMDLCLMVVSEGETNRRELAQALETLGDAPVGAVLLNKSSSKFFGRYYY